MKKLITVLSLIVMVSAANAQSFFSLGAKFGVTQGSLTKAPSLGSGSTTTGLVGGVFAKIGDDGLFLQPEILLNQRIGVFNTDSGQSVVNTLTYLDIPLLVGYKVSAFRFYGGPNFQLLLAANQKAPTGLNDPFFSKDNFNTATVGYQVGVGANLGKIWVDVRYDASIGDLGKTITTNTGKQINYSTRASMFQFTIGYKFL
jgi:hypothetical protein